MVPVSGKGENNSVVDHVNLNGLGPVVLVCEHASNFIPDKYAGLGLDAGALQSHIAWDPGALALAVNLSNKFDAPLIAQKISRLVYDCNRPRDAASAIPAQSEDQIIPVNMDLTAAARQTRFDAVYEPFRANLNALLSQRIEAGIPTILVTIHSFTPVFLNKPREVDIGILHDDDSRLADALLEECESETRYQVRRNQPYGPADGVTHTLREHGLANGLLNVMLEIRNDLVASEAGQIAMANWLHPRLSKAMDRLSVPQQTEPSLREVSGGQR